MYNIVQTAASAGAALAAFVAVCPAAIAQPEVQIQVDNSYARELDEVPATIEFVSSEPAPDGGLEIVVSISGSATQGSDYLEVELPLLMSAGESRLSLQLVPVDDGVAEDEEQIIITLLASDDYELGEVALATLFLQDSGRVFGGDTGVSDAGFDDVFVSDAEDDIFVGDVVDESDVVEQGDAVIESDAVVAPDALVDVDAGESEPDGGDAPLDALIDSGAIDADADGSLGNDVDALLDIETNDAVSEAAVTQPAQGCAASGGGNGTPKTAGFIVCMMLWAGRNRRPGSEKGVWS